MAGIALRQIDETQRLPEIAPRDLRHAAQGWARVEPADPLGDPGVDAWIRGRVGGERASGWDRSRLGPAMGETRVYRNGPLWHLPATGISITDDGAVLTDSASKLLSPQPDLAGLPGIVRQGGEDIFTPPRGAPVLHSASLFMPYGGFNYGHFFIDGLSALLAVEEAGLTKDLPPAAPRLSAWQRGLTKLAFPELPVRELKAPVVRIENATYSSNINHFLHHPNAMLGRLAERVRSRAKPGRRDRKIYLSRGNYSMRIMINAREVEQALTERGFEIVKPHRLSAADQAAVMAQARIVVGPTGAGMTNALFTPAGASVLEIQPENFASFWLGAACHMADRDWHGMIVASPAPDADSPWLARQRRGFRFGYRVPVDGLLKMIDKL